ncbi:hypothetical protein WJX82_002459 [Trebouxia sp. C0006]
MRRERSKSAMGLVQADVRDDETARVRMRSKQSDTLGLINYAIRHQMAVLCNAHRQRGYRNSRTQLQIARRAAQLRTMLPSIAV